MQRKDKQKIVDEVWTAERIRSFLDLQPPAGMGAAFPRLQRPYQSMRPEKFADFVTMFVAAGGRLDARGPEQQTLLDELERHRHGAAFAEILRAAG